LPIKDTSVYRHTINFVEFYPIAFVATPGVDGRRDDDPADQEFDPGVPAGPIELDLADQELPAGHLNGCRVRGAARSGPGPEE